MGQTVLLELFLLNPCVWQEAQTQGFKDAGVKISPALDRFITPIFSFPEKTTKCGGGVTRMEMPSAWGRSGRRALLDQFVRNASRQIFLLLNFLLFEFKLTHLSAAVARAFCQPLYYFLFPSLRFYCLCFLFGATGWNSSLSLPYLDYNI